MKNNILAEVTLDGFLNFVVVYHNVLQDAQGENNNFMALDSGQKHQAIFTQLFIELGGSWHEDKIKLCLLVLHSVKDYNEFEKESYKINCFQMVYRHGKKYVDIHFENEIIQLLEVLEND